jgi:hypothetical protein
MPDEPITTPAPAYVPPAVLEYLGSEEAVDINLKIMNKYELKDKDMEFVFELIEDIVEKRKKPKAVHPELRQRFTRWDQNKINALALSILGNKLLPLSNIVPGVEQEIKELGGNIDIYPKKKVVPPAVSIPELADSMIRDLNIDLPDKFLKHRLENIVTSKIKGVRDDFETKNRLIRGTKIGGLDIPPTQADQIIEYLDKAKDTIRIIDKPEAAHPPSEVPEKAKKEKEENVSETEVPEAIIKKETGKGEAYTVRPEDIEEIQKMRAQVEPDAVINEYTRVEGEIIKESGLDFSDPDMQKRFENCVRARVRDVRDELETRNFLTRGPREGGLGLAKEQADKLIAIINQKVGPLKQRLQKIEQEEKDAHLEKIQRKNEIAEQKEEEELNERFAKLTGRTPGALPKERKKEAPAAIPLKEEIVKPSRQPAPAPKPPASKPPTPPAKHDQPKPEPVKAPQIAPPPPAASVPAMAPPPAPSARPKGTSFPAPRPTPAPKPPAKPKPKVRVSGPSISAKAEKRPKVEEIKYAKKLFGPVEELRDMKLDNFRRLSKDPQERALKIKDKIDLLGEESFDKMMKGIAAWQESPTHKLYLNIIQEAFQTAKNVQTIIQQRESQGRPTLNWEEFQAIIGLNEKLKF